MCVGLGSWEGVRVLGWVRAARKISVCVCVCVCVCVQGVGWGGGVRVARKVSG